jgi:hypothetical protein
VKVIAAAEKKRIEMDRRAIAMVCVLGGTLVDATQNIGTVNERNSFYRSYGYSHYPAPYHDYGLDKRITLC